MIKHDQWIAWLNVERQTIFVATTAIFMLAVWIVVDAERSLSGIFFVLTWSHVHLVTWALIWVSFCIFLLLSVKWKAFANFTLLLAAITGGTALTKLFVYVPFWLRGDVINAPLSVPWSIAVVTLAFWAVFAVSHNIRSLMFFGLAMLGTSAPLAWQIADSFVCGN